MAWSFAKGRGLRRSAKGQDGAQSPAMGNEPSKPAKRRKAVRPVDTRGALAWVEDARAALSIPCPVDYVQRVEPKGELVAAFAFPLDLVPGLNRIAEMPGWKRQKIKKDLGTLMFWQNGGNGVLLPGRPFVRAIRFTSVAPDRDSGWPKFAVDRLTGKAGGLGFIVDDRPRTLDLHYWHEPTKPGFGFGYLEIWTGTPDAVVSGSTRVRPVHGDMGEGFTCCGSKSPKTTIDLRGVTCKRCRTLLGLG